MSVDFRNTEGYPDPTPYEAFRRIEEEKKTKPVKAGYKPLVYICAPYSSDPKANTEKVIRFASHLVKSGYIPVCPHLMFPPIADPKDTAQDEKAFGMCLKLIEGCHQVNVYGQPTEGMQAEITHAKRMGIPVRESSPVKEKGRRNPSPTRCPGR